MFPIFEEKINYKINKETDKKINVIKEKFVEQRQLELNLTEIRQSIIFNKDTQNTINDAYNDKIQDVYLRIE